MRRTVKQTARAFFANLRMLMVETGLDVDEVSRRSGVPKRTVYSYVREERTPSIENAEAIGGAFGLTGWQMILPNLRADLARSGALDKLIQDYSAASEDGRRSISRVADTEAALGGRGK